MPVATHYDVLEVSRSASDAVIRAAYKSLMQRYHPDRSDNDTDRVLLIREAYDVLSDAEKRAAYDHDLDSAVGVPAGLVIPMTMTARPTPQQKHDRVSIAPLVLVLGAIAIVLTIILSMSGLIQSQHELTAEKKAEFTVLRQESLQRQAALEAEEARKLKDSERERTVRGLVLNLVVAMPPSKNGYSFCDATEPCPTALRIPRIDIVFRPADAAKLVGFAQKNTKLIADAVRRDLKKHHYTEFATVDGEANLRRSLTYSINTAMLGSPFHDYSGVERLDFPSGFEVR